MSKADMLGSTALSPYETKDAGTGAGGDLAELKGAVDKLAKTFEDFKAANDNRIGEIEKKGSSDVITAEKVEKLNTAITEQIDAIKDAQKKAAERADQLEAAMKRSPSGGTKEEQEERKEAAKFYSLVTKKLVLPTDEALNVEDYRDVKAAFARYLRKTEEGGPSADELKALSVSGDPQGGYYVPAATSDSVIMKIFETSDIRGIAQVITIGTDRWKSPVDRDEVDSGWVGEKDPRAETDTAQIGELEIPVHEQFAQPKISQNLVDDSVFDVEAWLQGKVTDKFAREENTAFVTGDGVRKPRGFMDRATAASLADDNTRPFGTLQYVATGAAGAFNATDPGDALVNLIFELKAAYRQGARWVMARRTLAEVRKLKDGQGNYLWQPDFTNLQQSLLLGFPITEAEDMPPIVNNSFGIAFGNFQRGYLIIDRQGVRLLVDPYTAKPFIKYYTTKRVGGDVIDSDAIKLLKFGTS